MKLCGANSRTPGPRYCIADYTVMGATTLTGRIVKGATTLTGCIVKGAMILASV